MKLTEIQSTVYIISHSGKIHLDPNCRYVRNADGYLKKDAQAFPRGHERLCDWCENYATKWFNGQSVGGCDRCGKATDRDVCDDCNQQIRLRR